MNNALEHSVINATNMLEKTELTRPIHDNLLAIIPGSRSAHECIDSGKPAYAAELSRENLRRTILRKN